MSHGRLIDLGVERGDDGDRDQVVDDRERQQEDPQGRREEPADDRDHRDGERDVRRGRDRPAAQRVAVPDVDHEHEDGRGHDDAADGRGDRQRRVTRVAQAPGDELLLQLEADDEEEDREQTVGTPRRRRSARGAVRECRR